MNNKKVKEQQSTASSSINAISIKLEEVTK